RCRSNIQHNIQWFQWHFDFWTVRVHTIDFFPAQKQSWTCWMLCASHANLARLVDLKNLQTFYCYLKSHKVLIQLYILSYINDLKFQHSLRELHLYRCKELP